MQSPEASGWKIRSCYSSMGAKQSQVETARESSCPQKRQSARETNESSQLGNKRGLINTADLSDSTPKCLRPRKLDSFSARIRKDDTATIQSLDSGRCAGSWARRDREVKLAEFGRARRERKKGSKEMARVPRWVWDFWERTTCTGSPCSR